MYYLCSNFLCPLFLIFLSWKLVAVEASATLIKCAVCRSLVHELQLAHSKVNPHKKVETGSFRINPDGKLDKKIKNYVDSDIYIMELLEGICKAFEDYAQARHKETGEFVAMKMIVDGHMNPRFGEYDLLPDTELNRNLAFYCEDISTEYEEQIADFLKNHSQLETEAASDKFCGDMINICPKKTEEKNKEEL